MRHFNAVVLGAGGVGKSALTIRYMKSIFVDSYDPTIEEAYTKHIVVDGELCSLEVLDTAGVEQFTALNEYYIKGGTGFVLVFSLTQATTMREVENLRQQIFRIKGLPVPPPVDTNIRPSTSRTINGRGQQDIMPLDRFHHNPTTSELSHSIPLVIVGTKSDLTAEREVSREMVTRMATLWGVPFYETSSKRDVNVEAVFNDIVRQMKVKYPEGSRPSQPSPKKIRKHRRPKCVIQ
ncbi:hypothetical protein BS47DRAFT_583040 [Hydnum rufescens UP504]|uniref:Uncharacterized protein n=1 Tax=Hydnum rufescens UP504 TaxID=1448309 RepID=A0A9P6DWZ9_9AGAM|nr:hypothetical protein BS47DRAFT_583040 [Hydnum rufescens UP504]